MLPQHLPSTLEAAPDSFNAEPTEAALPTQAEANNGNSRRSRTVLMAIGAGVVTAVGIAEAVYYRALFPEPIAYGTIETLSRAIVGVCALGMLAVGVGVSVVAWRRLSKYRQGAESPIKPYHHLSY